MLYYVPQTDSIGEAAMAAFVLRLRTRAPKPEAITAGSTTDAALALMAAGWVDRIGSALADRVTLPLLQWDASLDGACISLTARQWYNERGRNRQAGADEGIDQSADDAMEYLARLKPGTPEGKRENPRFVDSFGNMPLDAPYITSAMGAPGGSGSADAWIDPRSRLAGGRDCR